MLSQLRCFVLMCAIVLLGSVTHSATITGTVKGPDGAPFQGAFVEAQNTKTKITVIVLSDSQGHYRIEKLPAGEYRVQIRAVGYRTEPRTGVNLTADQNASFDFALQKGIGALERHFPLPGETTLAGCKRERLDFCEIAQSAMDFKAAWLR